MEIKDKIKNLIISNDLDGYIIPKNDEFFTEYSKINKDKSKKIKEEIKMN